MKKGLVLVYTGEGKGKTTAALGLALRYCGHGKQIFLAQFRKNSMNSGEIKAIKEHLPGFTVVLSSLSDIKNQNDFTPEDKTDAQETMNQAAKALSSGMFDLVILDEINIALHAGLLGVKQVLTTLEQRSPEVDVVLTGRYAPGEILDMADTVSEMRPIKHHFNAGVKAKKGMEF